MRELRDELRRGEGGIYLFSKEIDGTKAGRQRHNAAHNNTTVPVRALLYLYLTLPALRLASAEEPRGERTSPYAGGTPVGTLDIAIGDAATGSKFEQKIGDVMRQYNYNVP